MGTKRAKLCCILPFYDPDTETHYYHLYELIEKLGEKSDIFLIIEKTSGDMEIKNLKEYYIQKFRFLPFRILELFILLFFVRLNGYRKFYLHYNILPALVASVVTKISHGETYLWSCVENRTYFAKWQFNKGAIKRKILVDIPTILAFKWIDFLVTCSCFMGRYYELNFGIRKEKILVIPNWVNLERFNMVSQEKMKVRKKMSITENQKVILYLGTLGEHKGAQFLPSITEKIKNHDPNAMVIIAGDGPYRKKLQEEIQERGLSDTAKIIGKLSNREVKNYYLISDIYIHPALREEFGRVLLEAMAMGLPFVSTDGGGGVLAYTSQIQQEFIVPAGKMENFCEKMIELLNDDKKREELRKEGFNVVKDFTLEKTKNRFEELIFT